MLGLMLSAPATASAAATGRPTGCTYEAVNSQMTVARCSEANGGHYRALAMCKDAETGRFQEFVGDWRNNGSWSKAYCQGSYRNPSPGIETKVT
ncbi:hypothetical protein SALBM311S_03185 [Streptomyces alboniger]